MKLRIAKEAALDVDALWDYTAERWNPEQADTLVDTLEGKFRLLCEYPALGRSREELFPGLRSLPVRGFVILYQVFEGTLEIARVLHGARDIEGLFDLEE